MRDGAPLFPYAYRAGSSSFGIRVRCSAPSRAAWRFGLPRRRTRSNRDIAWDRSPHSFTPLPPARRAAGSLRLGGSFLPRPLAASQSWRSAWRVERTEGRARFPAGGRKVAGSNPVAPIAENPLRERVFVLRGLNAEGQETPVVPLVVARSRATS